MLKYHYFQPPTIKNVIEFWQLWNGREPKNMDEIENQLHLPGLTVFYKLVALYNFSEQTEIQKAN